MIPEPLIVELFKGDGWQPWRFRLVSRNGQKMAASEGYVSKWSAKRAAKRAFPGLPVVGK